MSCDRWMPLKPHREQNRLFWQPTRFKVVCAGRRAGKSELAKRFLISRALNPYGPELPFPADPSIDNHKYFFAAPTLQQAKWVYWEDLKAMIPNWAFKYGRKKSISESKLTIELRLSTIYVIGLGNPEMIDGMDFDGGILDGYGSMDSTVWSSHVFPALSKQNGWAWFIDTPDGINPFYDLYQKAMVHSLEAKFLGETPIWDVFHWRSDDIIGEEEMIEVRKCLDEKTVIQEYDAQFVY